MIDHAYKTPTGALNQGWRGAPRALARVEPNQKHTPCSSQDRGRGVTWLLLTEMLLFLIENAGYAWQCMQRPGSGAVSTSSRRTRHCCGAVVAASSPTRTQQFTRQKREKTHNERPFGLHLLPGSATTRVNLGGPTGWPVASSQVNTQACGVEWPVLLASFFVPRMHTSGEPRL